MRVSDTCVVSVAFREPYLTHNERQGNQIEMTTPEVDLLYFRDQLPYSGGVYTEDIVTRFQESLYGFKPHAIQRAIDLGYKKVIWLDPSVLPICNMRVLIKSLDKNPMIVIKGDNNIVKMTNRKALDWFGIPLDKLKDVNHVGGTMYAFNFNNPKVKQVFEVWKNAEEHGIFGDQDAFMAGHWADESCMALSIELVGLKQYSEEKFVYVNQKTL